MLVFYNEKLPEISQIAPILYWHQKRREPWIPNSVPKDRLCCVEHCRWKFLNQFLTITDNTLQSHIPMNISLHGNMWTEEGGDGFHIIELPHDWNEIRDLHQQIAYLNDTASQFSTSRISQFFAFSLLISICDRESFVVILCPRTTHRIRTYVIDDKMNHSRVLVIWNGIAKINGNGMLSSDKVSVHA